MEKSSFKKIAVLSMDVEEWYHLDYINNNHNIEYNRSVKDGIERYLQILTYFKIRSNFFVVGEIIEKISTILFEIKSAGHEVGLHSYYHKRPITQTNKEFIQDVEKNIDAFNKINIIPIGYRAPCFSLGTEKLNILINKFKHLLFDSSFISQDEHPLYTPINLKKLNFNELHSGIYSCNNFFEFEVSTVSFLNMNIPVSGGGYLRILPWFLYKYLLKKYLKTNKFYSFYIHPFELSNTHISLPKGISFINKFRYNYNRKKTYERIIKTIELLISYGYTFKTYSELVNNKV